MRCVHQLRHVPAGKLLVHGGPERPLRLHPVYGFTGLRSLRYLRGRWVRRLGVLRLRSGQDLQQRNLCLRESPNFMPTLLLLG
jgi:hypothetical protein